MTTSPTWFALAGAALFLLGATGMVLQRHLLRKILAFNIMGSGAFLVLVGLAQRGGKVDYITHAMVLTGIVVSVAASALGLALSRHLLNLTGAMELPARAADD